MTQFGSCKCLTTRGGLLHRAGITARFPISSCGPLGLSFYSPMATPREGYSFRLFPFSLLSLMTFFLINLRKQKPPEKHTHMLPPTYLPVSVPVCSALSPVTMDKLSMLLSKVIPSSSPYTLLPTPGNDHSLPHAICVFLSTSSSSPAVIPTCCLILKKKKKSLDNTVFPPPPNPGISFLLQISQVVYIDCCLQIHFLYFLLKISDQDVVPTTQEPGTHELLNPMVNYPFSSYFPHEQHLTQMNKSFPSIHFLRMPPSPDCPSASPAAHCHIPGWVLPFSLASDFGMLQDSSLSSSLFHVDIYPHEELIQSHGWKISKLSMHTWTAPEFLTAFCISFDVPTCPSNIPLRPYLTTLI